MEFRSSRKLLNFEKLSSSECRWENVDFLHFNCQTSGLNIACIAGAPKTEKSACPANFCTEVLLNVRRGTACSQEHLKSICDMQVINRANSKSKNSHVAPRLRGMKQCLSLNGEKDQQQSK